MSIKVLSAIWDLAPVSGSELLVCLALADWSNDIGQSWPSMSAIAKKCRLSRSQARRVTHSLIEKGLLIVEKNQYGGHPGATRHYRIAVERVTANTDTAGSSDATARAHATGRKKQDEGVAPMHATDSADATQSVMKRNETPARKSINALATTFDAPHHLRDKGVPQELIDDWLALRKQQKAPPSMTAIAGIEREATRAKVTLEDALRICCERGWRGFNAAWVGKVEETGGLRNDYFAGGL